MPIAEPGAIIKELIITDLNPVTTTLTAAAAAAATTIVVANIAGFSPNQVIDIAESGAGTAETKTISTVTPTAATPSPYTGAFNSGPGSIVLTAGLTNAQPVGAIIGGGTPAAMALANNASRNSGGAGIPQMTSDIVLLSDTGPGLVAVAATGLALATQFVPIVIARFTYDIAVQGGNTGNVTLSGPQLPINFLIQDVSVHTPTAPVGAGASIAVTTGQAAADLLAVTAITAVPFISPFTVKGTPLLQTASTWIRLTTARTVQAVISGAALTAGHFNVYVMGVLSQ